MAGVRKPLGGKGTAGAAPPSLIDAFPLWEAAGGERDATGAPRARRSRCAPSPYVRMLCQARAARHHQHTCTAPGVPRVAARAHARSRFGPAVDEQRAGGEV